MKSTSLNPCSIRLTIIYTTLTTRAAKSIPVSNA